MGVRRWFAVLMTLLLFCVLLIGLLSFFMCKPIYSNTWNRLDGIIDFKIILGCLRVFCGIRWCSVVKKPTGDYQQTNGAISWRKYFRRLSGLLSILIFTYKLLLKSIYCIVLVVSVYGHQYVIFAYPLKNNLQIIINCYSFFFRVFFFF